MDGPLTRRARVSRAVRTPALLAVLTVVFLLALSGVAFADVWTDISDATWQNVYHVSAADASTVADGFLDGTFRPYQAVTRGQFAKMAVSGLGILLRSPLSPSFSDVAAGHIFYPYIEGAVDAGVISGYPGGTYRPDNNIIRQQANSILGIWLSGQEIDEIGGIQGTDGFYATLANWFAAEGEDVLSGFSDRAQVATVHRPGTAYLAMRGVVLGSSSGATVRLNPLDELTRAQAVTMILRTRDVVFEAELPTVTNVNPATGPAAGGNSVVITGTGFTGLSGAAAVKFGTVNAASYVVNSITQITAVAPAGTAGSTVDVTVTNSAGTSTASIASKYSYLVLPTVTALNPTGQPTTAAGTTVTITGTGFVSGATVAFGGTAATGVVFVNATTLTAVSPAHAAGVVDVTVTTPAGTSLTAGTGNDYTYGLPTVTALNPTGQPTTAAGTTVTITGTGFVSGATVAFGGTAATGVVFVNATTLTAVSPAHAAGVVDVTVTTPAGTSLTAGTGNDYTYGLPTVTALNPTGQPTTAAGTTVTITGTGFVSGATVAFGGTAATGVVFVNATTLTAVSPAHAAGVVDVTVTTPAGTSLTAGTGNDYTYGLPTVTALNPTGQPTTAAGTTVTITGTGFVSGATVAFGGTAATGVVFVNATTLTAVSPAHAAGVVDVTVTTPAGTSLTAGTGNDYTYGVSKFAVTMTGGTTPLSAVAKTAGTPFSVRVTAQDASGNTVTSYTGTVHLTSDAFAGTVDAVITTGGLVDSIAITPTIAGATRTIDASDGTTTTMNASGAFTVNPVAFTKLQILLPGETAAPGTASGKTGTPSARTAGAAFVVTVNAVDANWNLINAVIDTVAITSSDPGATLPANAALVAGTQTFNVTLTAGSWTVTATDASDGTKTASISPAVTVIGAFTKLQILLPGETAAPGTASGKTGAPSSQTAGTPFSVTVNAVDVNWNMVSSADAVGITSSDANATLPVSAALVAGTKTFSVTFKTAGSWTVTASDITDPGKLANISPSVTVNPGAFTKLQILLPAETAAPGTASGKTGAPSARTAGAAFVVTVNAVDANWNLINAVIDTVAITSSDPGATLPANAALVAGTRTFNVTLTAGSRTVTATDASDGTKTADTSPAITVN